MNVHQKRKSKMVAWIALGITIAILALIAVQIDDWGRDWTQNTASLDESVTREGLHPVVLNASPDIRVQLAHAPALFPTDLRQLPIGAVVLTNGDIDHVAGLLSLRELQ